MNIMKVIDKYKNLSPASKSAIYFTICNYTLKGVGLLTVPILTRILVPEEYGVLAEMTAVEEIIFMLSSWDISVGAYLKGLFKYEDVNLFTTVTQLFVCIMTICVYVILFLIKVMFNMSFGYTYIAIILMFAQHLFYPSYRLWMTKLQCNFLYKTAALGTMLYGVLTSIIPLLAVMLIGQTAEVKFCATMLISAAFSFPFFIKNIHLNSIWINKNRLIAQFNFIVKYQAPFLISSLSLILLTQFDRIIIGQLVGHAEAAYYGIACSITSILTVLYNSIGQALIPWKYGKLKDNKYTEIKKTESVLLVFAGGVTIFFVCVAPEIMNILFPGSYYEAVLCIPALSMGTVFNFVSYAIFSSVETFYEMTKYNAFGMVMCSGLNIFLDFSLVEKFGYKICAYTTAFSYLVYAFIHYQFAQLVIKKVNIQSDLYDCRLMIVIFFVTTTQVLFLRFLYPYYVLRYTIIMLLLIGLIWKRKWIFNIVKEIQQAK